MIGTPRAEQLAVPSEYGAPSELLVWQVVDARLADALHYWLATVRPDGRPHVVPVDGLWFDDTCYFGGSDKTVWQRNLRSNPAATLHLEDAGSAVIVEGRCRVTTPSREMARRLAAGSQQKYGGGPPESVYAAGVWTLSPVRVMAWTDLATDATRFLLT